MKDQGRASHREIVFHYDDETPIDFLVDLFGQVFRKPLEDTGRFMAAIAEDGQASCGSYPRDVARDMLEDARQRIESPAIRCVSRAGLALEY